MHSVFIGMITGAAVGVSRTLCDLATAGSNSPSADLASTIAIVIPVAGFGWYLSARLTRIEDAVNNLDCKKCPKPKPDS